MSVITELYNARRTVWSDIFDHIPFLRDTVAQENAQVVVELGARSGNSTIALLNGVEATGGHLYSVDIETPQWPGELWSHPQLTFVLGDDLSVRDQVPHDIDVLFVDSNHFYDHTLAELYLYGESAGIILMHDTDLDHPYGAPPEPAYPVRQAMIDWCHETGRDWYERENSYGLGVVGM